MRKLIVMASAFAVLMLAVACGSAQAVSVIYSNFNLVDYGTAVGSGFTGGDEYAERFVTADNSFGSWNVTEIKIMAADAMFGDLSYANINIYMNGTDDVGALIHQISNVEIRNENYEVNSYAISGLELDAGETYWIGLESLGWPPVSWMRTGPNYPNHPDYAGGPFLMDSGIYKGNGHVFELQGTVPEPATWALLGVCAIVLVAFRKRS